MRRISLKVTHRSDGRVCKKIDGEYMVWADEETARADILEIARRRQLGSDDKTIAATPTDPPLRNIANDFERERKPQVQPGTWNDYHAAIDQFFGLVNRGRVASSLGPDDFAAVRAAWAKGLGPWKLDNRIQSIRSMFNWAVEARMIDRVPFYGNAFHKTSKAEKRAVRRARHDQHGERKFLPDELSMILRRAKGPLRTFVLLGLNGGMYAKEIADLRRADLHKDGRVWVIDSDRPKTEIRRKFVLWPETLAGIEKHRDSGDRLFSTVHGNAWVQGETDSIGLLFRRLLAELKIKRGGVGFGSLRHTHVNAVNAHPDRNAVKLVRGHQFEVIDEHYDFPELKRIKAVTDLARAKLLTSSLRRKVSRRRVDAARRASAA